MTEEEERDLTRWFAYMRDECLYLAPKILPDGRVAFISRFMFTTGIIIATPLDYATVNDRWCYHTLGDAYAALRRWDGTGEPDGWHRHPYSGRRRPDGDPEQEYVNP